MTEIRDAQNHHLIGGELSLDFVNTLYGHTGNPIHEYLLDYRDLVLWSHHTGILADKEARGLLREAKRYPSEAREVYRDAISLRETIYRLFTQLMQAHLPKADELAALHATWLDAMSHSWLSGNSKSFRLDWSDERALERMLWPIADSAIKLLTSEDLQRVKQCNGCDWLFVDRSRNHQRRWCSMDVCGNRAKMRRRHARYKLARR